MSICISKKEFSEGSGDSTLKKKNLKAKHQIKFDQLFSKKEESQFAHFESDTSEENFGSNSKIPFLTQEMPFLKNKLDRKPFF